MSNAFDTLARPIQKWIRQKEWTELREIQVEAINRISNSNVDVIIAASTAGGKTEAAFLPVISDVLNSPASEQGFDILYIGPLKALITDQADRLESICQEAEVPIIPWHGDISQSSKTKAFKSPKGILLITPESLEAMLIRRGLEAPRLFAATRTIIIDELHTVLDSERGVQLRSLLTRLELAVKRPIRRIGLSATLGDMELTKAYLRPDNPTAVALIEAKGGEPELQLQTRGFLNGTSEEHAQAAKSSIASHLFKHLRGSDNLIFAGSRQSVEDYADRLRTLCNEQHLEQEFYPHHANLNRDHRSFVEKRLKNSDKPTTAICTSTLELGIDIGDVECVAQIGAPFSVASLRQRLGRSGRREGHAAKLRQYAIENELLSESSFSDCLRLGLIRTIAIIELLGERWYEPPKSKALHLSTLVHQILSVIAQHGGATASALHKVLCQHGPFTEVSESIFSDTLRAIGNPSVGLIEQTKSGLLLLGPTGERLVEHYSFYAVFNTPEEYRLTHDGRELGTLPIDNLLSKGSVLIFSGRRWVVKDIKDPEKVIIVTPSKSGVAPRFGGTTGDIHDKVIEKMYEILEGSDEPGYLDTTARQMLTEARQNYDQMDVREKLIIQTGESTTLLATRAGTMKTTTLALALKKMGFLTEQHDGFIEVNTASSSISLKDALGVMAKGEHVDIYENMGVLITEKYHKYLSHPLLSLDAASSRLAPDSLQGMSRDLLENSHNSTSIAPQS